MNILIGVIFICIAAIVQDISLFLSLGFVLVSMHFINQSKAGDEGQFFGVMAVIIALAFLVGAIITVYGWLSN
jgi:hypothetical protein